MEVFRNDDEFAEELSAYILPPLLCAGKLDGLAFVRSDDGTAVAHTFLPDAGKPQRQEREELSGQEGVPLFVCFLLGDPSLIRFKLLLVTWKSVLACLGGQTELTRVKTVARELAGLSPLKQDGKSVSEPFSPLPNFWLSGGEVDACRHASLPTGNIRQVPHIYTSARTGDPLDETG